MAKTKDDALVTSSEVDSQDDLDKVGYRSEFRREFSLLETVSFSLAIMAVSCGITTGYQYPLLSGGHMAIIWAWFIASFPVMCIPASMAELASSMPTSAGLYYFSAKMASENRSALASWITGWSNITGQITLVCSINYSSAIMITSAISMATDGAVILTQAATFGILMAIHFTQGIICSAGTRVLARMTVVIMVIILGTTFSAIIALLVCAGDRRVSAKTAFTSFENNTGWGNNGWAFILAFTSPMWSLTGYDSAAHIAEETANAARAAPIAILVGVAATEILGWLYYIAASFATQSVTETLQTTLPLPMGQVFLDTLGKTGSLALWIPIAVLQYMCGCSQAVDASRVVFAFSRDNALPGSRWWKHINPYTLTPINAVWFVILMSAICGILSFSAAAFDSLASASVIGLYVSYVTPIYFRITSGEKKFKPGPFSLGRWSRLSGAISVLWTVFMVIMLLFPYARQVDAQTMNYSVVLVMAVALFASLSWIFSARHWFTGPVPNIDNKKYENEKEEST
ncbi:amino acid transporter [Coniophora puteana RWD-64-598 SS2]|uniref:Amino acid transporter n=1 Tax=Coniophora puteana (strain RWD-64-598) TaxID=741705 RepID=A0A5M3MP62_CONPW|nr:amino acid transporter [Coniophora puteana RWD-64-598 SS2]EIW80962.1 amino acid transporter [Coniophora puteana RWD-64-598 SS2]